VLILLNHVASVALENAGLYREIQKSYFSTVQSLTSAIDAVSPATHGHSKRVTQYALILGEGLGLDGPALSTLKFGALLHDIGKLGISPGILQKQAPLSAEEYELVKEHPVIGERIISPVEFLQAARPIIRNHHERWDGRGYPDGLRGEEIPLGARIVAIADFYDAMLEDRPYRRGLDPAKVADEVRKGIGSSFDPNLCERFLQATGIAR
jgi:HD-GYP domain-containing protein (c-di-GMP phosphodiesterase class II)